MGCESSDDVFGESIHANLSALDVLLQTAARGCAQGTFGYGAGWTLPDQRDRQGRSWTSAHYGLAKEPPKWRASRDRNELHYSREDPIEHTLFFGKDWTPYSGYEGPARLREKRRMRMDKWMAEKAARTSSAGGRSFDRHDARDDRRYLPYPDAWSGKTQAPRHLPYPDARPASRYADAPRSSTHYREEEAPPGGYAHPRSDLHSQAREHAREHADARGSAFSPDTRI